MGFHLDQSGSGFVCYWAIVLDLCVVLLIARVSCAVLCLVLSCESELDSVLSCSRNAEGSIIYMEGMKCVCEHVCVACSPSRTKDYVDQRLGYMTCGLERVMLLRINFVAR